MNTECAIAGMIHSVDSPVEISQAAVRLRQVVLDRPVTPGDVMDVFDAWGRALDSRDLDDIPGILFLRMWLKRGNLEPVITRELGPDAARGGWTEHGQARCKAFPVGVVGHWPAGNVEIQPLLSMTCGLLGGNAALVRLPSGLAEVTRRLLEPLARVDATELLTSRIFMAPFGRERQDLHEAMAKSVDGAMIWGGNEAVLRVRELPFPHWARLAVFGPRTSAAALDEGAWSQPQSRDTWCGRLARDVWAFDQQACSSPQVLFLENPRGLDTTSFRDALRRAFQSENDLHPRQAIASHLTSAICQARAAWLMENPSRDTIFPMAPDWTLLFGGRAEAPPPTQGKTLTVLEVGNLFDAVAQLDGGTQTLGLGMADAAKERQLAEAAAMRGVDRVVKLGRMHAFVPPWDGKDLVRPMVRLVRHVPSGE